MLKDMVGFESIIERNRIKEHLRRAAVSGVPAHAYLLHGAPGSGKGYVAQVFVQALMCEGAAGASTGAAAGASTSSATAGTDVGTAASAADQLPCGRCHACVQAAAGTHPDIRTVTHEKASIGVDDIRQQVVNDVATKPYYGPYKIYIIPDAELMTAEAQNALLKTLEEPPAYCVLLLLARSAEALLETVRSRSVQIRMPDLSDEAVTDYLMRERHIPDYRAKTAARFARGNIGRALALIDDEAFEKRRHDTVTLLGSLNRMPVNEAMDIAKELAGEKADTERREEFFDLIRYYLRDLMVFKAVKDEEHLILGEEVSYISTVAERTSYHALLNANRALDEELSMMKANVSDEFALEGLMLSLRQTLCAS